MANEVESRNIHVIHESDEPENAGKVIVDDEVLAMIAAMAATEVEGVNSMAGKVTRDLIAKLSRNSLSKGIKIDMDEENQVTVYVSFNINFGYNIPEVAAKVQERIKSSIESMVGYTVKNVHVIIHGVCVDEE